MAFMNAKKRNKTLTYVIVAFVSVGLLLSVSLYWTGGSYSGTGGAGSPSAPSGSTANQDFEAAMNLVQQGKDAEAMDKFLSAIKGYETILKNDPNPPDKIAVLGDLATSYFYTGNPDKAIELAQQALKINPNYSIAKLYLAIYLSEGKNNSAEAIKVLKTITKDDPYYNDAQQQIDRISKKSTLPAQDTLPPPKGTTLPPSQGNPLPPK